jgi:hypothetical protein
VQGGQGLCLPRVEEVSCARRPRIVSTSCRGGRQVFSFYLFFKIKTAPLSFTCFYVECVQIGIRESKS